MVLGRRHLTSNEDVVRVLRQIETLVPRDLLERKCEAAIAHIRWITKGRKTAFAWSGGKDSLVLAHLLERAGVPLTGMIGITSGLEYPAMATWYRAHAPEGVTVMELPLDLSWLAAHPKTLFCLVPAQAGYWATNVWLQQQKRYCQKHGKDMLILGRRKKDGNYCGPDGRGLYDAEGGITRYLPIVDWTQEDVLAYLHYYRIELPPVYFWPHGFKCGGHPWPARASALDEEDGWAQTYDCDPTIVQEAANYLPGARAYLQNPVPSKSRNMHVWGGKILAR